MGFLTLAQSLTDPRKRAMQPTQAQPIPLAGPPQTQLVGAPQQPMQQDVSQYRPEVIPPSSIRDMQLPQPQNVGPAPMPQGYQQQYDQLFKPGPLQQQYSQAAQAGPGPAPHGFLGHFLGGLEGFALGGVGGAAVGAIAPGIPQRAIFRGVQLPQLAQQADQEMQQQGMQRQGYHALAQSTGYDPITHAPTLPMLQAQAMNQYRLGGLDARNRGLDIQQQRADEGERAHDMTEQYRQARLAQFQQGLANGSHVLTKGADGNQYVVDKNNPADAILVADKDGNPVGSIDLMLEGGKNYRANVTEQGRNSRFQQGQAGVESRFQRGQESTESRFQRSQQGMDRRAQKKGGGLLDAARQQLGIQPATPQAAPKRLSAADVKTYADRAYKGDVAAARARIARDNPDWVLP